MKREITLVTRNLIRYAPPSIIVHEVLLEEGLAANSTKLNPVDPNTGINVEDWTDGTIDSDFNW